MFDIFKPVCTYTYGYFTNYERLNLNRLYEVFNCFCLAKGIYEAKLSIIQTGNGYWYYSFEAKCGIRKFRQLIALLNDTIGKMGFQLVFFPQVPELPKFPKFPDFSEFP